MSKVIDVRGGGGDFVILGKALVLPSSSTDGDETPLDGSLRFNPESGAAEIFSNESWAPLGNTGDGGGAHTHTIGQITGLVDALAQKSNLIHMHPFSEIDGLSTALNAKANLNHSHGIANITGLEGELTTLETSLTNLAPTSHSHLVSQIAGLQGMLDGKAPVGHTHNVNDIPTLAGILEETRKIQLNAYMPRQLDASETFVLPVTVECTVPANFDGSVVFTRLRSDVQRTIRVLKNDAEEVGVITLRADSDPLPHTMITTSEIGFLLVPGDFLTFKFENNLDLILDTVAIAVLALRPIL